MMHMDISVAKNNLKQFFEIARENYKPSQKSFLTQYLC